MHDMHCPEGAPLADISDRDKQSIAGCNVYYVIKGAFLFHTLSVNLQDIAQVNFVKIIAW